MLRWVDTKFTGNLWQQIDRYSVWVPAIEWALSQGKHVLVRALVHKSAEKAKVTVATAVNQQRSRSSESVLRLAINTGRADMVALVVSLGADVKEAGALCALLTTADIGKQKDLVTSFLAGGADPRGAGVMTAAAQRGLDVVQVLIAAGGNVHESGLLGATADVPTLRALVAADALVDVVSLQKITSGSSDDLMRVLLLEAAPMGLVVPNVSVANYVKATATPLMIAVMYGSRKLVRDMLRAGHDPKYVSPEGWKATHCRRSVSNERSEAAEAVFRDLLEFEHTGKLSPAPGVDDEPKPAPRPEPPAPVVPWLTDIEFTRAWCDARREKTRAALATELAKRGLAQINVAVVGPVAAGKSSFINSVASLAAGRVRELAQSGRGEGGAVTRTLDKWVLGELREVALFDTRGWSAGDESDLVQLANLLSGFVEEGADLTQAVVPRGRGFRATMPGVSEQMHAVAVCVPWARARDGAVLAQVKRACEVARQRAVRAVVVVTHVDQREGGEGEGGSGVATSGAVKERLAAVAAATGVAVAAVVAVQSVAASAEVEWGAAAVAWKAAETLVERALDTLEAACGGVASGAKDDGRADEPLASALLAIVGEAHKARVDKWARALAEQDLETVGDVRALVHDVFLNLEHKPWCTAALHSALHRLRR